MGVIILSLISPKIDPFFYSILAIYVPYYLPFKAILEHKPLLSNNYKIYCIFYNLIIPKSI